MRSPTSSTKPWERAWKHNHGWIMLWITIIFAQEQFQDLDNAWQHVGAMLNRMIERSDTFCKRTK